MVCVPIGQVDPALFSVVSLALRPQSNALGAPSTTRAARRSDDSRIQEYSDFEKQFGIPPGSYLDAESETALRKADEEAQLRDLGVCAIVNKHAHSELVGIVDYLLSPYSWRHRYGLETMT